MELLTTFPLIVGAIANLATLALQTLVDRLLVLAIAALLVTGVGVFAFAAFFWLWLKHVAGDFHTPRPAHR